MRKATRSNQPVNHGSSVLDTYLADSSQQNPNSNASGFKPMLKLDGSQNSFSLSDYLDKTPQQNPRGIKKKIDPKTLPSYSEALGLTGKAKGVSGSNNSAKSKTASIQNRQFTNQSFSASTAPTEIFTDDKLPKPEAILQKITGNSDPDVAEFIKTNRNNIINTANSYGIQPELLAGVIAVELYGGGIKGNNDANRTASILKFAKSGKASLGVVQMTKTQKNVPNSNGANPFARYKWADQYDANYDQQFKDAAALLKSIAIRPNRYPTHLNKLTPAQMAIVATEYNKGGTATPAEQAKPSEYGRRFLHHYRMIMDALYPPNYNIGKGK